MSSNFNANSRAESQSNSVTSEKKDEKKLYCISGLGADQRVFDRLEFSGYKPVHLNWLEPKKRENISDYAKRLAAKITDENPIIIGLSFGGMLP